VLSRIHEKCNGPTKNTHAHKNTHQEYNGPKTKRTVLWVVIFVGQQNWVGHKRPAVDPQPYTGVGWWVGGLVLLAHGPFTVKLREILVRTLRPSIERKLINRRVVFDFLKEYVHQHANAQFTTHLFCQQDRAQALFVTGVCSVSAVAVSLQQNELGSGTGRRSVPEKQAHTFPGTPNALSLPLWPLIQRECRSATTNSARKSLTAT
jgi:hypothetical protein